MPHISPEDIDCDDFQDNEENEMGNPDEEQELDEDGDIIVTQHLKKKNVTLTGKDRMTGHITISKYEITALFNKRVAELAADNRTMLEGDQYSHIMSNPMKIARYEYLNCPKFAENFLITRHNPDGSLEEWSITEFKVFPIGLRPHYV